jgi:CBS domain-containing membrane protein
MRHGQCSRRAPELRLLDPSAGREIQRPTEPRSGLVWREICAILVRRANIAHFAPSWAGFQLSYGFCIIGCPSPRAQKKVYSMAKAIARTVADIMTRDVVCVAEEDNLLNLLESMHALRFRHTPITADGRLVGLLAERDLLRISASTLLPNRSESDQFLQKRFLVRDVMIRNVISVSPETTLREAAKLMRTARINCLPVVESDSRLVGIVTSSDFLRLVEELTPHPDAA